jgi:ABC-type transport system involved in multi-copper enzyme maturation permease subunit
MFKEIFSFEIRYHLRQPLFYVTGLGLFLLAAMFISTGMAADVRGLPGTVNLNAPFVILRTMAGLTAFGLFVVTAFVASSVLRDFRLGTHMLFFSRPVAKFDYLLGRFAGSMAVSAALLLVGTLGIAAGGHAPWQDAERIGPFTLAPYVYGLVVITLPNLLMMGAIFFAITSMSRSLLVTYIGVVIFLTLQDEAEILVRNVEHAFLGSLIEPLGVVAIGDAARYWTVVEYNTALPELAGGLLANRLLWLGLGLLLLAWSYSRFSYTRATASRREIRRRRAEMQAAPEPALSPGMEAAPAVRVFSIRTAWRQMLRQARLETVTVLKSVPFLVFLILGLTFIVFFASHADEIRGTPVHPVTHLMLESLGVTMSLFLLIVITVYSGEVIWRERSLRLNEVYGALPVSNGVFLGAKLLTLALVAAIFILAGIATTMIFQLSQGFLDIRPGLYARGFLVMAWPFLLMAILALFLQIVTNSKFIGYFLMVLFIFSRAGLPLLGLEHNLCRFPGPFGIPYSDLNGYGHHVESYLWFKLYWSFAALLLVLLSALFLVRGTESSLKARLAAARRRCRAPLLALGGAALAGFVGTGAYIFYNTNILNDYLPRARQEALRAGYENRYGENRDLLQPRVTDVYADVEIYPSERRVEIRGTYTLRNKTAHPVPALHLSINPRVIVNRMEVDGESRVVADPEYGTYIHELADPLAPGDEATLGFDLTVRNRGFVNHGSNRSVVENGTFFNNSHYFPLIGYDTSAQLTDPTRRRKQGLPPAPRMPRLDDEAARRNSYISRDADWITFETTVSTRPDQIAIAPGYLQREWEEGGRRHFHYKMDAPILNFFSYLSADYTVRRDRWNDVAIEVYYHSRHPYNVERMIDAVKKSLDYFTREFGPYQHRQVRIIEFPAYARFAQSFPNTIPFSEGAGFIARINDEADIDYVFNTTAHEVAHQWWAHQVVGGDAQGATLLSEGLSEYSSLMVMEKEYAPDRMRRFLRYELDGYLQGRGREVADEMPLMLVEDQNYIHYNKGSLILYALRDYAGEERVNRALSGFLQEFAFKGPPYPASTDLLRYLRAELPPEMEGVIEDMFERITLYANRAGSASSTPRGDGTYLVDLEVEARKLRADGKGVETEIEMDDWVDIGIFGQEETVLFLEKRRISEPRTSFQVIVDARPVRAGIDPYNKLIDREPEDNVTTVREVSGP